LNNFDFEILLKHAKLTGSQMSVPYET